MYSSVILYFTVNISARAQRCVSEARQHFNQHVPCEQTRCWGPVQATRVLPLCPVLPSLTLAVPLQPSVSAQEIPAHSWADLGKENNGSRCFGQGESFSLLWFSKHSPAVQVYKRGTQTGFSLLQDTRSQFNNFIGASAVNISATKDV